MMRRLRSVLFVVIAVALIISSLSACSYKAEPNDPVKDASVDFGCLLEEGGEITIEKVKPAPVDSDIGFYFLSGWAILFRHNAGLQQQNLGDHQRAKMKMI